MLPGIHPPKLLFAKTKTETGELPRFSGIPNWNLLSFKKIASRGLSKSFVGTDPSNSLNRRSRNLSEGKDNTTFGKPPTKRLLLRSSSKRSFNLLKDLGTVPQNRLELMWKTASSVKRPSLLGRKPAISAWFRSMLATTRIEGFDKEAVQNTPP